MNANEIREILESIEINSDGEHIEDCTYAVRTGENEWSICDNGEEVAGCDLETAVSIVLENLTIS